MLFNILYSLLDSESSDYSNSYSSSSSNVLSFFAWSKDVYATLPDYAILDFLLLVWTLFHLFVAISFVSMADAIYKKPLVQLHYNIVKPILHHFPMVVPAFSILLTTMTFQLVWKSYQNPNDSAATLRAVVSTYTWICAMILRKLSIGLAKMGVEFAMRMEQEVEKHDIKKWTPPPHWTSLYVMNHCLYGLEMAPFVITVFLTKNIFLRGLADNIHFGHFMGEFIRYFGGVNGTRDNVDALMENKDDVLVYPGGGHEVMKPCAVPKYTLMWKQRLGFARVAIKHGYPIIPCASVGTEDMMEKLFDINLQFVRKELKAPVVMILPHKLQRCYFWVGEAIHTSQYKGDYMNDEFAKEIRDKTKAAVEAGIRELLDRQANDPNRFLFSYLANRMTKTVVSISDFCQKPSFSSSAVAGTSLASNGVVPAHKKED